MDNIRYLELIFGAITSFGVLYALFTPYFRRYSRKRNIKRIIIQEMDTNLNTISSSIFSEGYENVQEDVITIGALLVCATELRNDNWNMLKKETSQIFDPYVFGTINNYYDQVASIISIVDKLKSNGISDDDRKIKLKDYISYIEFDLVFWVAVDVIIEFTEKYQEMLNKDKNEYINFRKHRKKK